MLISPLLQQPIGEGNFYQEIIIGKYLLSPKAKALIQVAPSCLFKV